MLANTTAQKVSYADVVCCFCCYSQECRSFLLPVVGGPPVRLDDLLYYHGIFGTHLDRWKTKRNPVSPAGILMLARSHS